MPSPLSFNKVFAATSGVAAAAVVGAAVANPSLTPAAFTAFGGISAGYALGSSVAKKKEQEKQEGAVLAQSFKHLYDTNRGILSADQLSYHTGISLFRINDFLSNLAAEQQGQKVDTQYGTVYSFPHPENVLNQLSENAQNWVKSKEGPLIQQIQILQQTVAELSRPKPQPSRNFSKELEEIQKLSTPEVDPLPGMNADPWNKL